MTLDSLYGLNNGFQATVSGPEIPTLQEGFPGLAIGLFEELFRSQVDLIRSGCLQVVARQGVHLATLLIGQLVGFLSHRKRVFPGQDLRLQHVCGFALLQDITQSYAINNRRSAVPG